MRLSDAWWLYARTVLFCFLIKSPDLLNSSTEFPFACGESCRCLAMNIASLVDLLLHNPN